MEGVISAPVCSKTWELSLYELHRIPHEVKTDDIEINVSPRSLHSELMCPICLDVLKNTMTTKECLHRFCQECIITALRSGNKECPTCRKKLVSKRSLRPDPNFDSLICKIFPSRDEYDAHQERVLAQIKQNTMVNSFEEGIRQQAVNRARSRKSGVDNSSNSRVSYSALSSLDRRNSRDKSSGVAPSTDCSRQMMYAREIEVIMLPHPDGFGSKETHTRYLKTTGNATVEHMSKYLAMRTAMDNERMTSEPGLVPISDGSYVIFVASSGEERRFTRQSSDLSLGYICDQHWKSDRPLELFYLMESSH